MTGPEKSQPRRLSLVEKRSVAYARLNLVDKGVVNRVGQPFLPKRVAYIPHATLLWIERLIVRGESDWPWFTIVLKFVNSKEYGRIEAAIKEESNRWLEEDALFWKRLKESKPAATLRPTLSNRMGATNPIEASKSFYPQKLAKTQGSKSTVLPSAYFWEDKDPNWWREQE